MNLKNINTCAMNIKKNTIGSINKFSFVSMIFIILFSLVTLVQSQICPNMCNEHGICNSGSCICNSGWRGDDCSISIS